jgi:hypothetical protein
MSVCEAVRMQEVRRGDGELCGHVDRNDDRWLALTVFGAPLGEHRTRDGAVRHVIEEGLAALADRWLLRRAGVEPAGVERNVDDEVVCIVEANADEVTVALGYYATPEVPKLTIKVSEIRSGAVELWR